MEAGIEIKPMYEYEDEVHGQKVKIKRYQLFPFLGDKVISITVKPKNKIPDVTKRD